MRRWEHKVSADWLKERRQLLTATEIKSLWPEYKRIKKKPLGDGEISLGFAGVWAEKNSDVELDVNSPSSAAARGHVMEPWAVDSWNRQCNIPMYHWDDCVIAYGSVGFSPDAMNVPQPNSMEPRLDVSGNGMNIVHDDKIIMQVPDQIMEIKCYEPKSHIKSVLVKDKMSRDEVLQVATAFYVLPMLKKAYLAFFCPSAPTVFSMEVVEYTRDDMKEMLEIVDGIAMEYSRTCDLMEQLAVGKMTGSGGFVAQCTEKEVWDAYLEEMAAENDFVLK